MSGGHVIDREPTGEQLRPIFRGLPHPVVVVTGRSPSGEPVGMTVSSFTSVSMTPPLVLFCPAVTSRAWATTRAWGAFAVNVLDRRRADLAARFAESGPQLDGWEIPSDDGVPALAEALTVLHCSIFAEHLAGDHTVVIGRVRAVDQLADGTTLDTVSFRRLRRHEQTRASFR